MTTCSEVMTKTPAYCLPSSTVREAARLMKGQNVGPIPVVESNEMKKLIGIVTDRDLAVKVVAEGRDSNTKIEEVMTRDPVACHPQDNLQAALDAMSDNQVRRIPVVDDRDCLVGIIAQADVATRIGAPRKTADLVADLSRANSGPV
jgi:CBS domain-containing protein